jgi:hypothetical protein
MGSGKWHDACTPLCLEIAAMALNLAASQHELIQDLIAAQSFSYSQLIIEEPVTK